MQKRFVFLLSIIINSPCIATSQIPPSIEVMNNPPILQQDLNEVTLMSAYDLSSNGSSNLNLTNNTGAPLTVYGLYLRGVAFITPGLDCQTGVSGGNNQTGDNTTGAIALPVSFAVGQSIPIGQNYLYNMIYNWIYWRDTPGEGGGLKVCALPGCSWPGDISPPGPGTGPGNWCLQVGGLSAEAPYNMNQQKHGVNVVPYIFPASGTTTPGGDTYSYDLIPTTSNYIWLGPFTCSDKTLTCSTPTPQFQAFPYA
jgi:hypothetical protein